MKFFSKLTLGALALGLLLTPAFAQTNDTVLQNIPFGTSLETFKKALKPAPQATLEVYEQNGTTVATDLQDGYKVIVTAGDNKTKKTYTVQLAPNKEATLKSDIGTVDQSARTISDIPYHTTLEDFKKAITPAPQAVFEVYEQNGSTPAKELKEGYRVIVTAGDKQTKNNYVIHLAPNTEATVESSIGEVQNDQNNIENIPFDTTAQAFLNDLKPAPEATFKLMENNGETEADKNKRMESGYKLVVTAGDDKTKKTYTIGMLPNTDATLEFSLSELQQLIREMEQATAQSQPSPAPQPTAEIPAEPVQPEPQAEPQPEPMMQEEMMQEELFEEDMMMP
ncbi:MAG: hypothetical protein K9M51_04225 [Candidatus Gracilibacteria bacterium]|nr:hypothetical protein [Candidatus Gracilibacteria bacterium]